MSQEHWQLKLLAFLISLPISMIYFATSSSQLEIIFACLLPFISVEAMNVLLFLERSYE